MNRRTFIPIYFLLALVAIIYAVYRSTQARIISVENGRQVVYGEPQHGLTMGMCVLAGLCLLGIALMVTDRNPEIRTEQPRSVTTRTDTNYPK